MREIKILATEKEIADLVKALQGLHAAEPEDTNEPQHENRRVQQSIAWTNANVDRVRQKVEITIKADAKEIAALVVAIQERREVDPAVADYLKRRAESLGDMHQ